MKKKQNEDSSEYIKFSSKDVDTRIKEAVIYVGDKFKRAITKLANK